MYNSQLINKQIIKEISEYIDEHPDASFGEILYKLGVIPIITKVDILYYESSDSIYRRMCKVKEKGL